MQVWNMLHATGWKYRTQKNRHLKITIWAPLHKSTPHHNRFTALFWDHPGEPVPEENFWTLWCKGRLTEADTLTMQLVATPSGLTSVHLHHLPIFFTGRMPFLPSSQQCRSTEGHCTTLSDYIFVLKRDVKLQLTNCQTIYLQLKHVLTIGKIWLNSNIYSTRA